MTTRSLGRGGGAIIVLNCKTSLIRRSKNYFFLFNGFKFENGIKIRKLILMEDP